MDEFTYSELLTIAVVLESNYRQLLKEGASDNAIKASRIVFEKADRMASERYHALIED